MGAGSIIEDLKTTQLNEHGLILTNWHVIEGAKNIFNVVKQFKNIKNI